MADEISEEQLREVIRGRIGWRNGKRIFAQDLAAEYGLSPAYLSDVLSGKRGIADRLAQAAGYERIVKFRPIRAALRARSSQEDG